MIANIWVKVLIFPGIAAAITWPSFSTTIKRKPVTANSRQTMIAATHEGTLPISTKIINAVITSILSAKGSANLPKLETRWCLLAICPSAKSVIDATAKMIAPNNWVTGIGVPKALTCPQFSGNNNAE